MFGAKTCESMRLILATVLQVQVEEKEKDDGSDTANLGICARITVTC